MKVQAITSAMSTYCCQPVNKVEFTRKKAPFEANEVPAKQVDSFDANSDMTIMEKKYDLACRVAAYYKTQYEELLKNGSCIA